MSHKPNAVPVLQEGTAYTIILDNGRKVHDVIYHACVASGKSYFAKGDKTYPAEKVRNHSITGHAASDGSRRNGTPNPDRFAITDEVCEVVDVVTTPETNPEMFRCRVKCLMYSGLSQAEAEKVIASTPLKLELFYDVAVAVSLLTPRQLATHRCIILTRERKSRMKLKPNYIEYERTIYQESLHRDYPTLQHALYPLHAGRCRIRGYPFETYKQPAAACQAYPPFQHHGRRAVA